MIIKYSDPYTTFVQVGTESISVPARFYDIINTALINSKYYLKKYYEEDIEEEYDVNYISIPFPILSLRDTSLYRLDFITTNNKIVVYLYRDCKEISYEIINNTED